MAPGTVRPHELVTVRIIGTSRLTDQELRNEEFLELDCPDLKWHCSRNVHRECPEVVIAASPTFVYTIGFHAISFITRFFVYLVNSAGRTPVWLDLMCLFCSDRQAAGLRSGYPLTTGELPTVLEGRPW